MMRQIEQIPGNNGGRGRPAVEASLPSASALGVKEIPYDYVATFKLQGKAGNRVPDVINISTDGAFVAVAIGYSFIPARWPPVSLPPKPPPPEPLPQEPPPPEKPPSPEESPPSPKSSVSSGRLAHLYQSLNGDLHEALYFIAQFVLAGTIQEVPPSDQDLNKALGMLADVLEAPRTFVQSLWMKLCGIDFKYSIIDSGSGRELQNQPIHNIAGLGEPTGDRPFRPFARPMLFMPRSTIRIEVEEVSEGLIYGFDGPNGQLNAQIYHCTFCS
jgi:hypothetical protein